MGMLHKLNSLCSIALIMKLSKKRGKMNVDSGRDTVIIDYD